MLTQGDNNDNLIEKIQNHFKEYSVGYIVLFALLGVIYVEYLYFSEAKEVRLLFVLLLIPIGAILGIAIPILIGIGLALALYIGGIALVFGAVIGIIVLLFQTIVWTNP